MKFELHLSESEHRYLIEASALDKKFRSLESFARDALLTGLTQMAVREPSRRAKAVTAIVGAGNTKRRKL